MNEKYLQAIKEQLPASGFKDLLNPDPLLCIAIKTKDTGYVYANQNHLTLMGFSSLERFIHKKDADLYVDPVSVKTYQNDDEYIYSTEKTLHIEGEIKPKNHVKLKKSMIGVMHPLCVSSSSPDALVVITKPKNKIINLHLEHLYSMSIEDLQNILVNSSYSVKSKLFAFTLARMEILCLAEMLKGKHAGEIAEQLRIKQLTVESYLSNLRNKCGTAKKSELIQFFIDNKVLENIII